MGGLDVRCRRRYRRLEMESKDELSYSKRHDADGGRHRFLRRHGRKFLRARLSKRAQIVGPKPPWRDWWRRHYLFGQWDTKDRRCKRSDRNLVANRNHNGQGINTWIGMRHRQYEDCVMENLLSRHPLEQAAREQ